MDIDTPTDGAPTLPGSFSVAGATLRALGLLVIAAILILVLLPIAIVAAGT